MNNLFFISKHNKKYMPGVKILPYILFLIPNFKKRMGYFLGKTPTKMICLWFKKPPDYYLLRVIKLTQSFLLHQRISYKYNLFKLTRFKLESLFNEIQNTFTNCFFTISYIVKCIKFKNFTIPFPNPLK